MKREPIKRVMYPRPKISLFLEDINFLTGRPFVWSQNCSIALSRHRCPTEIHTRVFFPFLTYFMSSKKWENDSSLPDFLYSHLQLLDVLELHELVDGNLRLLAALPGLGVVGVVVRVESGLKDINTRIKSKTICINRYLPSAQSSLL